MFCYSLISVFIDYVHSIEKRNTFSRKERDISDRKMAKILYNAHFIFTLKTDFWLSE